MSWIRTINFNNMALVKNQILKQDKLLKANFYDDKKFDFETTKKYIISSINVLNSRHY